MFAQIVVDRPLDQEFTYRVPEPMAGSIKTGSFVKVPFGRTYTRGAVVSLSKTAPESKFAIKSISALEEHIPPLSNKLIELFRWGANYYCSPLGEMIFSAVPGGVGKKPKYDVGVFLAKSKEECNAFLEKNKRAGNQVALLKTLMEAKEQVIYSHLDEKARVAARNLAKKGILELRDIEKQLNFIPKTNLFTMTQQQEEAYGPIVQEFPKAEKKPFLLHGVTGAGKTNIYLHLTKKVLDEGGSVLILLPEISLSYQIFHRFQEQFGDLSTMIHSDIAPAEKSWVWEQIYQGKIRVVVGARSALFAPLKDLKLIVVDEEHDASYKRDDTPCLHARDMAVVRAKVENAVTVLASATPSVETVHNVKNKKYQYLLLDKRVNEKPLPDTQVVDLSLLFKKGVRNSLLSPQLLNELRKNIEMQEQSILFLNRRGSSPIIECLECGEKVECVNCSISMTLHLNPERLVCHYCDRKIPVPHHCPKCGKNSLNRVGIGTQKLQQAILEIFPEARVLRLDSDTSAGKGGRKILDSFRNHEADILIGTQMVTKGHDFPKVSLVGIVLVDQLLNFPDFRSVEKTYQLLVQASGRAGRGDIPGRVVIQTYSEDHFALRYAIEQDMHQFYREELINREELSYPPFSRMAVIRLNSPNESRLVSLCEELYQHLISKGNAVDVMGPTPALIYRVANRYRYNFLLKSKNISDLKQTLGRFQAFWAEKQHSDVRMKIDVDPLNTL